MGSLASQSVLPMTTAYGLLYTDTQKHTDPRRDTKEDVGICVLLSDPRHAYSETVKVLGQKWGCEGRG